MSYKFNFSFNGLYYPITRTLELKTETENRLWTSQNQTSGFEQRRPGVQSVVETIAVRHLMSAECISTTAVANDYMSGVLE